MSIFDNYENLSSSYVPDNQQKTIQEQKVYVRDVPQKEYDVNGNFIGYSFSYGDTITIDYSINKIIYVEDDALVYYEADQEPNVNTIGVKGQKAYNVKDLKCWLCTSLDSNNYIWKKLNNFIYPKYGTKEITLPSSQFTSEDSIEFEIYNFRHEKMYSEIFSYSNEIQIVIDKDLSKKFLNGIYYCSIRIFNNNMSYVDSTFLLIVENSVQNSYIINKFLSEKNWVFSPELIYYDVATDEEFISMLNEVLP